MPTTASPHFLADEFRCHDGTPYPPDWVAERLTPLCAALEAIRDELGGRAIRILSGYRTQAHNDALRTSDGSGTGVAQNSQHIQGRAADIAVDGVSPSDVHAAVLRLYAAGRLPQLGGLGLYRGWVHVDVRPRAADGHLARWTGAGVSSTGVA